MIAFALAAAIAATTPARLPPVDRCRDDAGFSQFRARLEDAVTRKDVAALRQLTDPDIRSSFGDGTGWADFASMWNLAQPTTSGLWKEMQSTMALGCAPTEAGGRVMPGLFEDMGDDTDPFELLVIRPGAAVRSAPQPNAAIVATGDWTSVIQLESNAPDGWINVRLPGGQDAWVETGAAISPLDYRLVSEKRGSRWVMTAFIAGD
jgi:hypothetical protein